MGSVNNCTLPYIRVVVPTRFHMPVVLLFWISTHFQTILPLLQLSSVLPCPKASYTLVVYSWTPLTFDNSNTYTCMYNSMIIANFVGVMHECFTFTLCVVVSNKYIHILTVIPYYLKVTNSC